MDFAFYVTTCWHFCPSKEPCCHWPSFLRLQIRWQGWFCPHHSSTPREKEMGPRAVCRADHSIAAEPSRQSEVLGLGTWRPSKSIGPCRHSRRLPSGPSCAPTSGAARQLPPSTARAWEPQWAGRGLSLAPAPGASPAGAELGKALGRRGSACHGPGPAGPPAARPLAAAG